MCGSRCGRCAPSLLLASLAAVILVFFVRTIRWRYLLSPLGETRFRTVFRSTVIGFGALALLPIRVGDVIRPYLLARQERMPVTSVFATVVMERVLDLVAVLALLAIYVWGFAGEASFPARLLNPIKVSATIAAGVAGTLLVVMWILATHPERIGGLAAALARVLPGKLSGRVGNLASTFSSGFAAARNARQLFLAVIWSFALWIAHRDAGVDSHDRVRDPDAVIPARSCCSRCSSLALRCRRPAAWAAFTRPIASG